VHIGHCDPNLAPAHVILSAVLVGAVSAWSRRLSPVSEGPSIEQQAVAAQLGTRASRLARVIGRPAALALTRARHELAARRAIRSAAQSEPLLRQSLDGLSDLRDVHRGETCVIIGNGPSLRSTDISLLRDQYTFGLNRVYLAFDDWGFSTTYHVSVNKYVAEQSGAEMAALRAPLFTTIDNLDSFRDFERDTTYLWNKRHPGFYGDVRRGVWEGATVTYVAMQLAFHMGFRRAVLVGVDHRFASTGPAHRLVTSESDDPNHFLPNYFGPGYNWQLPDLETSEIAYAMAKRAYENDGREVIDATVDGALQVFPKMELSSALDRR
jgi:hypothetical protein